MRGAAWGMGALGLVLGFWMGWLARPMRPSSVEEEAEAQSEEEPEETPAEAEPIDLESLLSTARAAAAMEPLDREALATLASVEDEIYRAFEGVWRRWDKNREDPALIEQKNDCELMYKEILLVSDAAVERFFTPDVVGGILWRDLLADPSEWKSCELKGYEHDFSNGTLHLVGPDPSENAQGIISIGDKEAWRDFLIEMELTILKGDLELFFRLSPVWQKNVESLELTTDEGGLEAGCLYAYRFSVIASTLIEEEEGKGLPWPSSQRISWTQIRKGAFGIAIPKDTEVRITKLRAKVLR